MDPYSPQPPAHELLSTQVGVHVFFIPVCGDVSCVRAGPRGTSCSCGHRRGRVAQGFCPGWTQAGAATRLRVQVRPTAQALDP